MIVNCKLSERLFFRTRVIFVWIVLFCWWLFVIIQQIRTFILLSAPFHWSCKNMKFCLLFFLANNLFAITFPTFSRHKPSQQQDLEMEHLSRVFSLCLLILWNVFLQVYTRLNQVKNTAYYFNEINFKTLITTRPLIDSLISNLKKIISTLNIFIPLGSISLSICS